MFDSYYKLYEECVKKVYEELKETHVMNNSHCVEFVVGGLILSVVLAILWLVLTIVFKNSDIDWLMIVSFVLEVVFSAISYYIDSHYKKNKDMEIAEEVYFCSKLNYKMSDSSNKYPVKELDHYIYLIEKAKEKVEDIILVFERIKQKISFFTTALAIPMFVLILDKIYDAEKDKIGIGEFGADIIWICLVLGAVFIGVWVIFESIESSKKRKYNTFIQDMETIINIQKGFYDKPLIASSDKPKKQTKRETQ